MVKRQSFHNKSKKYSIEDSICSDTEYFVEKINACDNDLTKSLTSKINRRTACDYSLFTNDFYRDEDSKKPQNRSL